LFVAEPELSPLFVETGFYLLAFEMLFTYPTNDVLHDVVLQLFLMLCTRQEDEMMEVFVQTNILDKIGQVWDCFSGSSGDYQKNLSSGKYYREKGTPQHCSYFAHLAILANMIDDLTEEHECLKELISVSDRWQNFTKTGLPGYNSLNIGSDISTR